MKLLIVQHGEAVPKQQDPQRPLSESGRASVARLAMFLRAAGVRVPQIYHSGKARAQQTADILATALLGKGREEYLHGLLPEDSVKVFAERLVEWSSDMLVVGHMPFVKNLASRLLTHDAALVNLAYQPGSVTCLERDEDGNWALLWMLRPDLLP